MKVLSVAAAVALASSSVYANDMVKEIVIESRTRLAARGIIRQEKPPSVLKHPSTCTGGFAAAGGEQFPCENVDFLSFLSLNDLEIEGVGHPFEFATNDIWGWLSPTKKEVTIIGLDNGVALVDSTDPTNPCIMAKLPTGREADIWGDMKVYKDTLYAVKDKRGGDSAATRTRGIEVYDLLPFDEIDCHAAGFEAPYAEPDFIYDGHGRAHNIVVNTESGRLYSVGSQACASGFVIMDIKTDRLKPTFLGCADADGYTHDAQCLVYDGPDQDYQGKEICLGFNEDTLTIWDLTDATNPIMISRTAYPNQAYSHQGWFNADLTKILLDDELDEECNSDAPPSYCADLVTGELTGQKTTSTYVWNAEDLDAPTLESVFIHKDLSIDHNLYIFGSVHKRGQGGNPPMQFHPDPRFAYLANYLAGLRILDISATDSHEWKEVGSFDVSPELTAVEFAGSWSTYLHPSGTMAISSIERGLFLVKPRMAYTAEFPPAPTSAPVDPPTGGSDNGGSGSIGEDTLTVLLVGVVGALAFVTVILSAALVSVVGCQVGGYTLAARGTPAAGSPPKSLHDI